MGFYRARAAGDDVPQKEFNPAAEQTVLLFKQALAQLDARLALPNVTDIGLHKAPPSQLGPEDREKLEQAAQLALTPDVAHVQEAPEETLDPQQQRLAWLVVTQLLVVICCLVCLAL